MGARLAAEWRLKTMLSIALTVVFCVPYFTLQRIQVFPVRRFQPSFLDIAVAFDPDWVWAYQSVYLLIGLVPWLSTSRSHLRLYTEGFLMLAALGFLVFLLLPVAGPRPDVVPANGMFRWLTRYDAPTNAFPSLHMGLATYTLLFAARAYRGDVSVPIYRWTLTLGTMWVAAIAYGTLAIKQHYAVDLPAGMALAGLVHRHVWRRRAGRRRAAIEARAANVAP